MNWQKLKSQNQSNQNNNDYLNISAENDALLRAPYTTAHEQAHETIPSSYKSSYLVGYHTVLESTVQAAIFALVICTVSQINI